jgi:type IV secretory pathway VirB2 component (pilin)
MNTNRIQQLLTQARNELKVAPSTAAKLWVGLNATLLCAAANATPKLDFTGTTDLLTEFVKFIAGPFGKAAVIISIVAAFITWVFAPREGIFGPVLRVVVAGIAVMNAAIWVSSLGAGGNNITLT